MKFGRNSGNAQKTRMNVDPAAVKPDDIVLLTYGDGDVKDVPHRCIRKPEVYRNAVVLTTSRAGLRQRLTLPRGVPVTVMRPVGVH